MSKHGHPCGQKPEPLPLRLRNLLKDYRRDVSIFKELIQNADDAGASQVIITLDTRQHPTANLPDPRMSRFMGPALLCANDRPFSVTDREHIETIGDSSKATGGPKIGRFGLGFNTVYNISDYPSFLTNGEIVCFDPYCSAVAEQGAPPGCGWWLTDLWKDHRDWPMVFVPGGIEPDRPEYDGTIFRFPLRPPEQPQTLAISPDPFLEKDFHDLLKQLQDIGPSLLLFTRSVLRLEVRQISPGWPSARVLWAIETANTDEVRTARAGLYPRDRDVSELIAEWRGQNPAQLPRASYRHVFRIRRDKSSHAEHWQVVTGIFSDSAGELLRLASELGQDRVIPWAGAAARLDQKDDAIKARPVEGHFYCGMPLPQLTDQPVHLNGHFEVHTSRQRITTGNDGGRQVRWNDLLLQHAVAEAYVELLDSLHSDAGEADPRGWYSLWPKSGALAKSVYSRLAERRAVRIRHGDQHRWTRIRDVPMPSPELLETLQEPLIGMGIPLPEPQLPSEILEGFVSAGVALSVLTPAALRQQLRNNPITPHKDWVDSLLEFCLDDEKQDLAGLPLALMADGQVRIFQQQKIILGTAGQIEIFPERQGIFLDPDLRREFDLKEDRRLNLFSFTPEMLVNALHQQVHPADQTWRLKVLRYLGGQKNLVLTGNENFRKVPLIPDQFGGLHPMGLPSTPLLCPDDIPRPLWDALTVLKVPLVSGDVDFREVLAAFRRQHRNLVLDLTAANLIDTLATLQWGGGSVAAAEVVLDFLADDGSLQRDKNRLEKLRRLQLLPIEGGGLVSAATGGVYLPGGEGFDTPPIVGEARMLKLGREQHRRPLYTWLGLDTMTLSSYIREVLLRSKALGERSTLRWLAAHYQQVDKETHVALCSASLVRARDGRSYPAPDLYDYEVESFLLPATAQRPDLAHYGEDKALLLPMFLKLGLRDRPTPADLHVRIGELVASAKGGVPPAAEEDLARICEYMSQQWESLQKSILAKQLHDLPWVPALRRPRDPTVPGFREPEDRLFRPSELYPADRINLIGSLARFCGLSIDTKFRKDLGFATELKLDMVLGHFTYLLDLCEALPTGSLRLAEIGRSLQDIYQFIGQRCKNKKEDTARVREQFGNRRCIWVEGRLWRPEHVFTEPVRYLTPWRTYLSEVNDGLDVLGRRLHPQIADLTAVLDEINKAAGGEPLPLAGRNTVLRVLSALGEIEGELGANLNVLTRDQRLAPASKVYLDDVPWRRSLVEKAGILLLDRDVLRAIPDIDKHTGVRRLSACLLEELSSHSGETEDEDARREASRLEARVHTPAFAKGLRRLLQSSRRSPQDALQWLDQMHVKAVDHVEVQCKLRDAEFSFDRMDDDTFFDAPNYILYVAAHQQRRMSLFTAQALSRQLDELEQEPIRAMLDCDPGDIALELDVRRVPTVDAPDADEEGAPAWLEEPTDESDFTPQPNGADGQGAPAVQVEEMKDLDVAFRPLNGTTPGNSPTWGSSPSSSIVGSGLPGTGRSASRQGMYGNLYGGSRHQVVTYVTGGSHERQADPAEAEGSTTRATLAQAALAFVMQTEEKAGWQVSKSQDHMQSEIEAANENQHRHIIVKSIHGPWDRVSIEISPEEYEFFQTEGEVWLYVVEHVLGPQPRELYRIQNPVGQITQYRLDSGWKHLAERDESSLRPTEGLRIELLLTGETGVIEEVDEKSFHPLLQLQVRLSEDVVKLIQYDPLEHRLLPPREN